MSYIGAGASVVGGIMQSIAASEENKAMMAAFQQELNNQLGYQGQAYGQWMGDLPRQGSEAATKAIGTGTGQARDSYSQTNAMPLIAGGGSGSSPESGAYASTDKAALDQEGAVRSKLQGMSNWQLQNMIDDIKNKDAINRINFRSAGDAQVFPYKMYNAQHSADELDFWGKTIASIGGGGGAAMSASGPPSQSAQEGLGYGAADIGAQVGAAGVGAGVGAGAGMYMPLAMKKKLAAKPNTPQTPQLNLPPTGY